MIKKVGLIGTLTEVPQDIVARLLEVLDTLIEPFQGVVFLHGGAKKGVVMQLMAMEMPDKVTTVCHPPAQLTKRFIPLAFLVRNKDIINNSDLVIVIKNGDSREAEVNSSLAYVNEVQKETIVIDVSSSTEMDEEHDNLH